MIFLSQTTREILLRYAYFEMFLANERQNRIPKLLVESRILFKYWKKTHHCRRLWELRKKEMTANKVP